MLELQIRMNERLPPRLRCDDAILDMKQRLVRLKKEHLKLIAKGPGR